VVAAVVYSIVPPFVPVLERVGPDMPLSARMLLASYPFAIALPLAAAIAGIALGARRAARLVVPVAYAIGAGVLLFLALALYVPMFELS
jgi:type II secretory pathway component PulF